MKTSSYVMITIRNYLQDPISKYLAFYLVIHFSYFWHRLNIIKYIFFNWYLPETFTAFSNACRVHININVDLKSFDLSKWTELAIFTVYCQIPDHCLLICLTLCCVVCCEMGLNCERQGWWKQRKIVEYFNDKIYFNI